MKIIDIGRKGNLVRFYLGDNDCDDYWGDDWDDRPYEHNAGSVYKEYVKGTRDVVFPFDWVVTEPADDWIYMGNSPFSKQDFIERKAPALAAAHLYDEYCSDRYSEVVLRDDCVKFYFGDPMEPGDTVVYEKGKPIQ